MKTIFRLLNCPQSNIQKPTNYHFHLNDRDTAAMWTSSQVI